MRDWIIWLWRAPRTLLWQILALEDTHHSKALGVAIGMFIGMTPTVGIQMILVMVTAVITSKFFQFNRVAALLTVYISNPLTMLPIYWMDYKVGTWFVPGDATRDQFAQILEYHGFREWWETILGLFVTIGTPLIVGSLIVASVCSLLSYPLMRWLLHFIPTRKEPSEATTELSEMEPVGREILSSSSTHSADSQP
ncbi:MAG: DUF2062 domain-containing protein [Planctomycetaceae bacterium]|nr:DUF2062 domain-containing protein [Planctomycetaceae bacterium]